jgi:hypothetical protein
MVRRRSIRRIDAKLVHIDAHSYESRQKEKMVDFEKNLLSGTLRNAGNLLMHQFGQSGFDP